MSPALRTVTVYGTKSPIAATSSAVLLSTNSAPAVGSSGMSTAGAICPATDSAAPNDAGNSVYGAPGNACSCASGTRRRRAVAVGRLDDEAIVAGGDERKAKYAGRKRVDGAARIGDGLARDELGGVGADAVVAAHRGRRAAACGDEAHAGAVDRRAGLRIEHEAERIDDGRGRRRVGGVERVGVGAESSLSRCTCSTQSPPATAVAARLHVARETARVDGRLGEHDRLAVAAGRRDGELDAVDDGGVAVAVGIDELEEHGFAAMHGRRRAERQRLAERERLGRRCRAAAAAAAGAPPLRHSVGCATPMLPLASARSSVSAARDGAGTTTTSTVLLTTVVGPLPRDELHLGTVADRACRAAPRRAVAASSSAANAAEKSRA